MALDITAYEKAEFVSSEWDEKEKGDPYDAGLYLVDTPANFAARIHGMRAGYHKTSGEEFGFRAGSYSGYNWWRELLAKAIHHKSAQRVWHEADELEPEAEEFADYVPMPAFYELIEFSDCEGCIGTEVSKKLHKDFGENREKYVEYVKAQEADIAGYCINRYDDWLKAFEIASKGGFVAFH
jgi:hypothetical protein